MKRDEKLVLAIAALVSKRMKAHVGVIQTPRFTEWRLGDKGFAVGPTVTSYPARALVDTIQKYLTPPRPINKRDL